MFSNVEYTYNIPGFWTEAHDIWVPYTHSKDNGFDNTIPEWIPSFQVLYFSLTSSKQIVEFYKYWFTERTILSLSKQWKKT
jgi:hypothetical protein